jgi:hypothetical protein
MVTQRQNLTFKQKHALCQYIEANPNESQINIALWAQRNFNLPKRINQTTISRIYKQRALFQELKAEDEGIKKVRILAQPHLDQAIANWVLQCQDHRIAVSGDLICEKAFNLAQRMNINTTLRFSHGWLQGFKARHGFKTVRTHGESGSAPEIPLEQLDTLRSTIQTYAPENRFNMDETGLFYRMAPDQTIATRQIAGTKKDKTRLTLALMCNQTGTLKDLFIIGTAIQPRCFKSKTAESMGFYYRSNKKAWMTGLLFQEYMKRLDDRCSHPVLLLVDGGPHGMGDYPP